MQYDIVHDLDRPLCFIGNTFHNHTLYNYFKHLRPCEHLSLEEVAGKDQAWIDSRQFMGVVTSVSFKKQIADTLADKNIKWFSVKASNSHIGHNVLIGYNTFINHFNVVYDDVEIGDHCTLANHLAISHCVIIGNYCHISPFSYLCFTTLGNGVCIGIRGTFPGKPDNKLTIADWSNFMLDSIVTESIASTGTYSGKRKQSDESSLELKIF
jgi:NDP-sugar pyrophosphorylase family protein